MAAPKILLDAFNLPPEAAIEFFEQKGYTFSWDWKDVWQEAHSKTFTVAKAMRKDVLQDIREMVQKALDEGITFAQFKKELEPKLREKGWWGKKIIKGSGDKKDVEIQLGSPWRLKTIYRANMQSAYMAGRYKGMMSVADRRPNWQYIAVLDRMTRPTHRILHGKVFRADDPFWDTHYAPNGWGCRCRVRSLSDREMKRKFLQTESSAGKMRPMEVTVGGRKKIVTVYTNETGKQMAPDPGWNYNPGKAAWKPDKKRWDSDIQKL